MEGEINDRKWSDDERQNSVENEYTKLVSDLLIGKNSIYPKQKYKIK